VQQNGQLQAKHQKIELFGILIIIDQFRWKSGDIGRQLNLLLHPQLFPSLRFGVLLHEPSLWSHDKAIHTTSAEIVEGEKTTMSGPHTCRQ
jgi:hypothetical protein